VRIASRLPTYLFALVTFAACVAVFAAAVVTPAPLAVLPLAALICVGCPAIAAWQMRDAIAATHEPLAQLRRGLAELPEVEHPLGL
jgi:hypothetical protein